MATYKEFQEALAADEELRARCIELAKGFDPEDEEEAPEAMSQIAAKLGFDVSASEFRQAAQAGRELGDDELDAVAGGSTLFRIVSGYPLEKRREGVANWY